MALSKIFFSVERTLFFGANHISEGFDKEENSYFHNHIWRKSFPALTGHTNCFHPPRLVPLHFLAPMAKAWVLWETSAEAAATLRQVKKNKDLSPVLGILQVSHAVPPCRNEPSHCHWLILSTQKALSSTQRSHLASLSFESFSLTQRKAEPKDTDVVSQPCAI